MDTIDAPLDIIAEFKTQFLAALKGGDRESANFFAMAAANAMLSRGNEERARQVLWGDFFSVLDAHYTAQYQSLDFEIADYQMFSPVPGMSLFRGPRPSLPALASGRYVTFLGAAQLFGRYHTPGIHTMVGEALGIETLNLSYGGAGPEFFLRQELLDLANASGAVVLQVLSGRSIGCDEYPGMRTTYRRGDTSGQRVDRLVVLTEIWQENPREAIRLVRKWRLRYLEMMHRLIDSIRVPIVLTWISSRAPGAWSDSVLDSAPDFGAFPQLVDGAMVQEMASRCARYVEISDDDGIPFGFVSRFTGKKCPSLWPGAGQPHWKNTYYPSSQLRDRLAVALAATIKGISDFESRFR